MKTLMPFVWLALSTTAAFAQTIFPLLPPSVSTVPANGDVNPYGVAFAPKTIPAAGGHSQAGNILVSNFNNNENLQGTGTTIVRIDNTGLPSLFYSSSTALRGLTAALGILSNGLVVIGNLPTADGTSATVTAGHLALLNRDGDELTTLGTTATINGPWGATVYDTGNGISGTAHVFIANVLAGSITRVDITYGTSLTATLTVIGSGLNHRVDPAALVLGPSGLAYDAVHDTLYFASSADDAVYFINPAVATQTVRSAELAFGGSHPPAWTARSRLCSPMGTSSLPKATAECQPQPAE